MKVLHVVLVCHTEVDFDGGWGLFEKIQPRMEQVFASVADKTGKMPKVTYCVTGEFLAERLAEMKERLGRDGEIDVFQSFWHHFEFAELGWTEGTFTDAEKFLLACGEDERVVFSTASEAASNLERNEDERV